jgi:hypothetical protein
VAYRAVDAARHLAAEPTPPQGTDMSPRKSTQIPVGAWSGLAAPAIAAGAVHYTTPWYIAVPVLVVVLGLSIWRRRRRGGGGGSSGRGPFGGS